MTLIQGQMLTYGPQEQLEPAILSSWKSVSPLEFQYTVRPGVKFSDGNPVTAGDIAYTLNLQLNPKLASQEGGLFVNVKSVTSSGNVVTLALKHPDVAGPAAARHDLRVGLRAIVGIEEPARLRDASGPAHRSRTVQGVPVRPGQPDRARP